MNRLKSPAQYVQGKGLLKELDVYLQGMGNHLLVLMTAGGMKRIRPVLENCFAGKDYTVEYAEFSGECTRATIMSLVEQCQANGVTTVVGIGGGRVLDTAKGVAHFAKIPMVIVPTVCSTDAPCSSLSVMYFDDGVFDAYLFLDHCPDLVLVDVDVIVAAPVEFLVAGMGDALATWFEAKACRASGSNNQVGSKPSITATQLAKTCWEYLKADGLKAKQAVACGVCTPAVEHIIEVNTYLSSVGFESGGLAAAHGIQKGFTVIPELHPVQHGEKVAFCTLTQLVLENMPTQEIEEVMEFCLSVGLPICFGDMGYTTVEKEAVVRAAEKACVPGSTIHNLPFQVTADMVADALIAADAMGRAYHNLHG